MTRRHVRSKVVGVAVGAALVLSSCGNSDFSAGSVDDLESAQVVAGSSDGGSFVGRPSGGGDTTDQDDSADAPTDALPDTEDPGADEQATPEDGDGAVGVPEGVPSDDPGLSTDPDIVYLADTCYTIPNEGGGAVQVGCGDPHIIEIYAIRDLPGGPDAAFLGLSDALALCNEDFQRITGVGLGLATIYTRSVLRPSEETWADGERDVTCYVRYPESTTLPLAQIDPVRGFGLVSVYGMEIGDCFIDFENSETTFNPVPCEAPHDAEVFIDFDFPDGPFPGEEAIEQQAEELCFGQPFEDYVGRDYPSSAVFSLQSRPTEETWNLGDRAINCLLTDETVRTGSLRDSGL